MEKNRCLGVRCVHLHTNTHTIDNIVIIMRQATHIHGQIRETSLLMRLLLIYIENRRELRKKRNQPEAAKK